MKKEELQSVHDGRRAEAQADRHVLHVVVVEPELPVHAAAMHARKTRTDLDAEEVVEEHEPILLSHAEVFAERANDDCSLASNDGVVRSAECLLRAVTEVPEVR